MSSVQCIRWTQATTIFGVMLLTILQVGSATYLLLKKLQSVDRSSVGSSIEGRLLLLSQRVFDVRYFARQCSEAFFQTSKRAGPSLYYPVQRGYAQLATVARGQLEASTSKKSVASQASEHARRSFPRRTDIKVQKLITQSTPAKLTKHGTL